MSAKMSPLLAGSPLRTRGTHRRGSSGVDDPGLDQPDRRVVAQPSGAGGQEGRVEQPRVVVEEEQELALHVRDAGVAAGRDAEVLGQVEGSETGGEARGLPPVPDHDDVEVDILLRQQRVEAAAQLVRPRSHGEDDHAEREAFPPAHATSFDNRGDAQMASPCPTLTT